MEACEQCGFSWESVGREQITGRASTGAAAISAMLLTEPQRAALRPLAGRWSMLEYGAHVRDVLITIRDRLVIGLVEQSPGFKPMYRDERIDLGLYRDDSATAVVAELTAAASMFGRLFDAVDPQMFGRTVQYGFPSPMTRSLLWMGQQAVHEVEHHLGDLEEDLRLLSIGN